MRHITQQSSISNRTAQSPSDDDDDVDDEDDDDDGANELSKEISSKSSSLESTRVQSKLNINRQHANRASSY